MQKPLKVGPLCLFGRSEERSAACDLLPRRLLRSVPRFLMAFLWTIATPVFAQQSPWGIAAQRISIEFTGPIARSFVLIGIVISGFTLMFSEGGGKRTVAGLVFGGALCLGAVQFVTWLFT